MIEFHLRVEDFGRCIHREVPCALNRFPHRPALLDGKILMAQLNRNRPRRRGNVLQAQSRQGVADQGFELSG